MKLLKFLLPLLLCVALQAHPADERSFQKVEIGIEADQLVVVMKLYCGPKLSQRFYQLLNTDVSHEQGKLWQTLVRGEAAWLNFKQGDLTVWLKKEEDYALSKLKIKLHHSPSPLELFQYLREEPVQQYHLFNRVPLGPKDSFRGLDLLPNVLAPSYKVEEAPSVPDDTSDDTSEKALKPWPMLMLPYRYEIPLSSLKLPNLPVLKIKTDLLLFSSESFFQIDPALKKAFNVISSEKMSPDKSIRHILENKPGTEYKKRQVIVQWKG